MSDSTITPGPWTIRANNEGEFGITGKHDGHGFLHVCTLSGDEHHDAANARLIAAAPDLLAACKALVGKPFNPAAGEPGHVNYGDAVKMAVEAITKAQAAPR